jgi:hypothetical protein
MVQFALLLARGAPRKIPIQLPWFILGFAPQNVKLRLSLAMTPVGAF